MQQFNDTIPLEDMRQSSSYLFQSYHLNSDYSRNNSPYHRKEQASGEDIEQDMVQDHKVALSDINQELKQISIYAVEDVHQMTPKAIQTTSSFEKLALQRRSLRHPIRYVMSFDEVSYLLETSVGITQPESPTGEHYARLASPSPGGLNPIETFVVPLNIKGLDLGCYHYNPSHHALERLGITLQVDNIQQAMLKQPLVENSTVLILMSAKFRRLTYKYGERSYRLLLLQAGGIGEHIALAAEAIGLRSVMIGGYLDSEINSWVGANGVDEAVILCCAIGKQN